MSLVLGFRGIERATGINHNTIINWVRQAGLALPDTPEIEEIPSYYWARRTSNLYRLKKNKFWLWTAVNHGTPGILAWILGDRSAETFKQLWKIVKGGHCFWYVTDAYVVYPMFIDDICHLVSKTYMTRVEGENTRVKTLLSTRTHRKTLCYSKSSEMLIASVRLLLYYLKYWSIPLPT